MKLKRIADLFCGAGGTSTGALQACSDLEVRPDLLAVNHWQTAVNTHTLNHPGVRHICGRLENIKPEEAVPSGRLDLLCASPECIGHSIAAGGRPKNDQSRCQAWIVCDWLTRLDVDNLLIENVREFMHWGRLRKDGLPNKRYKGEYFKAFLQTLDNMGYKPEWRIVNAADFGDPTSRKRLFILARRGKFPGWPVPTHFADGTNGERHRAAREVIDWSLKGKSIFRRKRPLAANTMRRIAAGLRKFGGSNAEPFLVMIYGTNDVRSIDRPVQTVTAKDHVGLAQPFIVTMEHEGSERSIERPLPTITTARGGAFGLVEPFITHLTHQGERRQHSIHEPLPTVTTFHRGEMALCEPIIIQYNGKSEAHGVNEPLATVTTRDRFMLVEPKSGKTVVELDILFRMLQPHELAAAMSFPKDYKFTGTRGDQVKQIGNAVPVQLARAHARALLQ